MDVFEALILAQAAPSARAPFRKLMWLLLFLGLAAMVLARIMVMLNRAALRRLRDDGGGAVGRAAGRTTSSQRRRTDAWVEAGRRVPLEDDPDVPREPPDEPPPQRGFNDRR